MNLAATLQRARQISDGLMPDTGIIKTRSTSVDDYGATTESFVALIETPCRFTFVGNAPKFQEKLRAAGIGTDEAYLVQVPHGTTLPETGRIEIKGNDYAIVTEIPEPSYEVCAQALVQRVPMFVEDTNDTTVYPGAIDDFSD